MRKKIVGHAIKTGIEKRRLEFLAQQKDLDIYTKQAKIVNLKTQESNIIKQAKDTEEIL